MSYQSALETRKILENFDENPLLTRCYSDCLYKTTAGIFATITFATNLHCRYNFLINRYIRQIFIIRLTASQSLYGTSPLFQVA